MTEKTRTQNQDDWKRTQIRIPLPFYEEIVEFAEQRNISINTAMLELMDRGVHSVDGLEKKGGGLGLPPYAEYLKSIGEAVSIAEDSIEKIAEKVAERLNQK